MRHLTPIKLVRLSTDERSRLLDCLLRDADDTWLSEREREHLEWGHGVRCKMRQDDFDAAAAKVARERRLRLALALVVLCGVPPCAALRVHWNDVKLKAQRWNVPRRNLPKAGRASWVTGRRWDEPRRRFMLVDMPKPAADVFRKAREVRDGWGLLRRIVRIRPRHLLEHDPDGIRQPLSPPMPRGDVPVFPASRLQPLEYLPEHAMGYCLRAILRRLTSPGPSFSPHSLDEESATR